METFFQDFWAMVDGAKTITFLVLFIVDFIAGVVVAIKAGEFAFNKLANCLSSNVLFLIAGYYLIGLMVTQDPAWQAVLIGSYALIIATMVANIGGKLKKLGLPIPDSISKLLVK
ncbi:MAG: phage holin family protein [Smithellaceae bacterium]|jgi:phage-related holin